MSNIQERPLTEEERAEFETRSTQTLINLEASEADATPETIVELVDAFVDKWQSGGFAPPKKLFGCRPAMPDAIDVALGLGIVWGNQIVKKFGWEWICIKSQNLNLYCVATPDRAWIIFPTYFIKACLDNPNIDCTAMLSFNMMASNRIPEIPANS